MKNTYLHFLKEAESKRELILATVIRTRGSTPQVSGAAAVFGQEGLAAGTLGGGLMEYEAGRAAQSALRTGKSRLLEFNLQSDINDDYGAICGGQASVLIDRHPGKHEVVFKRLKDSLERECPGVLVTRVFLKGTGLVDIERFWYEKDETGRGTGIEIGNIDHLLDEALTGRKPVLETHETDKDDPYLLYLEPVLPDPRLVIVGAGHIGRALTHLAHLNGFNVTVIDNRPEMADRKFLPGADRIITGPVDEVLKKTTITANTFVVIVTQGHRYDADALKACIRSEAAYTGMIGSRRKISLMREQFINEGWATPEEFDRVHAPIGLAIHAETIQEIAVSIMAELIKCRKEVHGKMAPGKISQGKASSGKASSSKASPGKISQGKASSDKASSDKASPDKASPGKASPGKVSPGSTIAGIVLAAGESKRMGRQKLLMPYNGKTFIETILDKISASEVDYTRVVVGHEPHRIIEAIKKYPAEVVHNEQYRSGMLSSVQAGLKNLPHRTRAVLIFLGDQPMVKTAIIDRLIEACRHGDRKIVLPVFEGRRGHPVLIDLVFKKEIFNLDPDKGLRDLIHRHETDVLEVHVDSPEILKDIDTIEDYKQELT